VSENLTAACIADLVTEIEAASKSTTHERFLVERPPGSPNLAVIYHVPNFVGDLEDARDMRPTSRPDRSVKREPSAGLAERDDEAHRCQRI
jgi:hypothetical protein